MSISLHFSELDWERVERDWAAWWAGELDRPLVVIEGLEPPEGVALPEAYMFVSGFPPETPADEIIDRYQAHLEAKRFYGDAFPHWFPNLGPAFLGAFLGAKADTAPDAVWLSPDERLPIKDLHLGYMPDNLWWQRTLEVTRAAVQRWGSAVSVAHTDLGGNLDVLAHLLTAQDLLFDFYDAPGELARLVAEMTPVWLRYYDELYSVIQAAGRGTSTWSQMWAPGRTYMLQCDLAYMISPQMFERFVLPDIAACCDALDCAFFHLDGKGQIPHLDMLLSLERLRGIQWIPGDGQPPPEAWLPLLKRIRDAGKLCQPGWITPQGARMIVRELGGRGFVFWILERMSKEDAEDFVRVLAAEDIGD